MTSIRGGDIACRYGGEEFLVILPDISSNAIEQRAHTLLEQIRALRIPYQEQQFFITVSMGVAMFPKHGIDVQHVVTVADSALYQAKHQGRDQFVMASSVSTDSPNDSESTACQESD
jgi:diguanylate cyclase (GGDEF)-like protein